MNIQTSRRTTSRDRKSTRLNSSHRCISYAVFCLKKIWLTVTTAHLVPPGLCRLTIGARLRSRLLQTGISFFFFFNDTATTKISPLSLHDALPICQRSIRGSRDERAKGRATGPNGSFWAGRSEEHTSELQHRCISYAVFCLKKKKEAGRHARDPAVCGRRHQHQHHAIVLAKVLCAVLFF